MAFDGGNAGLVYSDGEPVTTEYAWAGAANLSESIETVNGMEVRRNRANNPVNGRSLTNTSSVRSTAALVADYVRSTITDATAGAAAARLQVSATTRIPVTAGETLAVSVDLRQSTGQTMAVQALWYNAAGTYLSATVLSNTIAVKASSFTRFSGVATPPTGAVSVFFYIGVGTGNRAIGDTFDVRRLLVGDAGTYFDGGSTPRSTYRETLDGGQAASTYTNIVLEPKLDRAPVERVEVTIKEILPSATYIDLYRLVEGRSMLVRGGVKVYAVGGLTVVDFEAPFGVQMTYRAEMFADQAGTTSLGYTGSADIILDVTTTCVHQPLNPQLAVWPAALAATAADIVRRTEGELVYPEGATVGTWLGSERHAIEGLEFDMLTRTRAEADTFQAMLGDYSGSNVGVLCIRTPPPVRIPRVFFGTVAELHEVGVNIRANGEMVRFQFTSDEALPPAPGLVTAILTRDDVDAAYPTREARAAAYLTRLDRDRDYSLAGLAG